MAQNWEQSPRWPQMARESSGRLRDPPAQTQWAQQERRRQSLCRSELEPKTCCDLLDALRILPCIQRRCDTRIVWISVAFARLRRLKGSGIATAGAEQEQDRERLRRPYHRDDLRRAP